MKVLLATPSYFPIIGGSETLTRTLSIKLNEMGVRTDVMTLNMCEKWNPIWREEVENNGSFTVFRIPALNPFSLFPVNPFYVSVRINVLPDLDFVKRFEDYDIIHFIGETELSFAILSYRARKPKIMHCVATTGLSEFYRKHFMLRELFRLVFPRIADLYLATAAESKALLDMNVPASRILTLPFAVDTEFFKPDVTKKLDNMILFVGRIDRTKGLHVLLNSLFFLSVKSQVVIIGPQWGLNYFKEINEVCQKVNREGYHTVNYLGAMNQNDLPSWYQRAAVLVRPDLLGLSGGTTALEALSCGTPVIGTGNDVVKDNVNGMIVPTSNPKELAAALDQLLEDKKLREKYGTEGRRIVEQSFSFKSFVRRLMKIYELLLHG